MATSENASAIENRHTPPTAASRASEPRALAAKVAGCPVNQHRIVFIYPLTTGVSVTINQVHAIRFHAHLDGSSYHVVACPLPPESTTWCEESLPLPAPHINGSIFVSRAVCTVMPSSPATHSAHF